jgi:aminomethyltransferase
MARDRGHLNRTLMGLKVDASDPLPAGAKVTQNGQEVGQITSSVWSPLLQSVIALAYLKRGSQQPRTVVEIANHQAIVTSLPFAVTST